MKKLLSTLVVTTALAGVSQSPAFATSGALDFLDPCIKARSDFAEQKQVYFAKLNITESSIDTLSATPAFKTAWLAEVRKQARPLFDAKLAPSLRLMGATDIEKAFSVWFDMEIAAVKPEDLGNRINADFRRLAKDEMSKAQVEANSKFDESQKELGDSCKADVGSQALRLTLAPIG